MAQFLHPEYRPQSVAPAQLAADRRFRQSRAARGPPELTDSGFEGLSDDAAAFGGVRRLQPDQHHAALAMRASGSYYPPIPFAGDLP
jgi:hypothetical protein